MLSEIGNRIVQSTQKVIESDAGKRIIARIPSVGEDSFVKKGIEKVTKSEFAVDFAQGFTSTLKELAQLPGVMAKNLFKK